MTLQELKRHEAALNELAFREAMRDMCEFYGREKLKQIIKAELAHLGIQINATGQKTG